MYHHLLTANETAQRAGARRFKSWHSGLSSAVFAADARFPAPVGDFFR